MADGLASVGLMEPVGYVQRDGRGRVFRVFQVQAPGLATSYGVDTYNRRVLVCKIDYRGGRPRDDDRALEAIYEPFILDWLLGNRSVVPGE